MTHGQLGIFALLGGAIWLSGAVMFRFSGHLLFESGPWVLALSGVGVAVSVCLLLHTVMSWRKAPVDQSLIVAVSMALPGLFGDVAYILAFSPITGLRPETVGAFAAVIVFGNAALLAFALRRSIHSSALP